MTWVDGCEYVVEVDSLVVVVWANACPSPSSGNWC